MIRIYKKWIRAYKKRTPHLLGRCIQASAEMHSAFPELTVVKGHVHTDWGKRGHVWLTTVSGDIVDPTAKQFNRIFEYEPWKPGDEVRTGKCMNCGDDIWKAVQSLLAVPNRDTVCGEDCEAELRRAYSTGQ